MPSMMRLFLVSLAVTFMIAWGVAAASAQFIPQITNPVPPVPPPPAPPPPSLAVPPVPKMDAPPQQPKSPSKRSFSDRINNCLTDSTASRLDTTERAAYSRACANQQ